MGETEEATGPLRTTRSETDGGGEQTTAADEGPMGSKKVNNKLPARKVPVPWRTEEVEALEMVVETLPLDEYTWQDRHEEFGVWGGQGKVQ